MTWLRSIGQGLKNFWDFRREVWTFRGWDYEYTYTLFLRGLELNAKSIQRHHHLEGWKEQVAGIQQAIDLYKATDHMEVVGLKKYAKTDCMVIHETEQKAWRDFHDWCRDHGQGWWD